MVLVFGDLSSPLPGSGLLGEGGYPPSSSGSFGLAGLGLGALLALWALACLAGGVPPFWPCNGGGVTDLWNAERKEGEYSEVACHVALARVPALGVNPGWVMEDRGLVMAVRSWRDGCVRKPVRS